MAPINLKESIDSNRIVVPRKWYNRENTELGLNSQILRKVILFLETVPVELKTAQGIKLYFTGLNCINMIDLSQFYKEFLNSRNILSESDIRFLEKFFVNKMDTLLSE